VPALWGGGTPPEGGKKKVGAELVERGEDRYFSFNEKEKNRGKGLVVHRCRTERKGGAAGDKSEGA